MTKTDWERIAARMRMTPEEREQDTARAKALAKSRWCAKQERQQLLRRKMISEQDRRCPVCDLQIDVKKRGGIKLDEPSQKVLCPGCYLFICQLRHKLGPIFDRAIKLITDHPGLPGTKPEEKH